MKLKPIFASMAVSGLALVSVVQYRAGATLRAENESLRRELAAQKASAPVPNDMATDDSSLTPKQLAELLKLRAEVTRLREQANEIGVLRRANEELRASLKEAKTSWLNAATKKTPDNALPQDIHRRETWTFRGYASPDDTVESFNWAASKGDRAAFMAALIPERQTNFGLDMSDADFAEKVGSVTVPEYRILDRHVMSDDVVISTIYYTREDKSGNSVSSTENFTFQKIDGQWKIADSANVPK